MNIKDHFSGSFYNADNIKGTGNLIIDSVDCEDVSGEEKMILSFRGVEERLVCNKTNAFVIAEEWGDETDDWVGGTVRLTRGMTMFKGKRTPCVNVECVAAPVGIPAS